jgi:propionyl-CoA carboxylase beta chain
MDLYVLQVTVLTRKGYGGGYNVMCSKPLGCDLYLAWPGAHIAVMGESGAKAILGKSVSSYAEKFGSPLPAASAGIIRYTI